MSIHCLPDLCLVTIFTRVPLVDRLRAGQVCSKWRYIRSIVTSNQRSLTILVGSNASELIETSRFDYPAPFRAHLLNDDGTPMFEPKTVCEWSSLKIDQLETKSVLCLANLFSNIHALSIAMNEINLNQLLMVAFLFGLLADKLVNLKIFFLVKPPHDRSLPRFVSRQLFDSINSMPLLKHLTLEFENYFALSIYEVPDEFAGSNETISIDLPILSQLDEFNFYSADYKINVIFDSLQRYAQHSLRPLRIQFGYLNTNADLSKLVQLDQQFCHRFTRLIYFCYIQSSNLNIFCTHFTSVTYLNLGIGDDITVRKLINNLTQLTQLVHLWLQISFCFIKSDESNVLLPQLHSVKSIDLQIDLVNSHNFLSLLNIPWTFPNVQVMGLDIFTHCFECDLCGFSVIEEAISDNQKNILKQCLQQVLIPLRQCAQLHTIAQFDVKPFQVAKLPLTKEDMMQTIELKYVGYDEA